MRIWHIAVLSWLPVVAAADTSSISIDHAWSRAAMSGHQGAVYMSITDTGSADTLTSVSSPVATSADVHETINDNGVMKMRPVASLAIAPGKAVTLAPGGYHIMLMNLKHALNEGDSFPITLTFAKSGPVTTMVQVEKAGATMPGMSMPGMSMPMHSNGGQPSHP